jgi:hypothetical protein
MWLAGLDQPAKLDYYFKLVTQLGNEVTSEFIRMNSVKVIKSMLSKNLKFFFY